MRAETMSVFRIHRKSPGTRQFTSNKSINKNAYEGEEDMKKRKQSAVMLKE